MNQFKIINESFDKYLNEDTIKQGNSWVNKGKDGTHGKFKTKKAADAQRKAMFAKGFKESKENYSDFDDLLDNIVEYAIDNIKETEMPLEDSIAMVIDDKLIYNEDLWTVIMQYKKPLDLFKIVFDNFYSDVYKEVKKRLHRIEIKEESLGSDLDEYQKWVDYDMKRFGKISKQTLREIDEAGLLIVKDKYGDYEVIAKGDKLREAKEGTYYYINNELSEKDAFYRSLRNTGADYIDSDKLRKGITIDNTKFLIRTTPIDEAMDISGIKGTIANAFTQHKGEFNKATTPSEILKIANDILVEEGVNIDAPSVTKFLNLLQKSKTLNNSLAIVYNYILAGSGQNVI